MKGCSLGLILGILLGLALRLSVLEAQDVVVWGGIVFLAASLGYVADMLIYIRTDYQIHRRLEEVTRR